jgi:MFS family permease
MASGNLLFYIIKALYMSGWNFGELAGPIAGGLLITYVDFARSSSIFGFVILFATAIFFSYLFLDWKKQKTSKVDDMEKLLSH